jgi:hypothetical protein
MWRYVEEQALTAKDDDEKAVYISEKGILEREQEVCQIGAKNGENQRPRRRGESQKFIRQKVFAADIAGSRKAKTSDDTTHQNDHYEMLFQHCRKTSSGYYART